MRNVGRTSLEDPSEIAFGPLGRARTDPPTPRPHPTPAQRLGRPIKTRKEGAKTSRRGTAEDRFFPCRRQVLRTGRHFGPSGSGDLGRVVGRVLRNHPRYPGEGGSGERFAAFEAGLGAIDRDEGQVGAIT